MHIIRRVKWHTIRLTEQQAVVCGLPHPAKAYVPVAVSIDEKTRLNILGRVVPDRLTDIAIQGHLPRRF